MPLHHTQCLPPYISQCNWLTPWAPICKHAFSPPPLTGQPKLTKHLSKIQSFIWTLFFQIFADLCRPDDYFQRHFFGLFGWLGMGTSRATPENSQYHSCLSLAPLLMSVLVMYCDSLVAVDAAFFSSLLFPFAIPLVPVDGGGIE